MNRKRGKLGYVIICQIWGGVDINFGKMQKLLDLEGETKAEAEVSKY